jgi:hypothetical protein
MGPGGPPLLPNYDFLTAPDDYAVATKLYSECNFLQALDGGLDPAHVAFLHWNRARGSSDPRSDGNGRSVVYAEETDYGVRIAMVRPLEGEQHFIGITDYILPSINAFTGLSRDGYSVNWFVPIDDVTYWKFNFTFSRERTLAKQTVRDGRTPTTADYYPAANRGNRYLQDREAMRTESFSGIPSNMIQAQDACACDGAGRIQDRAQEHLATTDRGIVASRTALLKAIRAVQAGGDPPHVIRDPAANRFDNLIVDSDVVPSSVTWQTFIAEAEARRREASVLA